MRGMYYTRKSNSPKNKLLSKSMDDLLTKTTINKLNNSASSKDSRSQSSSDESQQNAISNNLFIKKEQAKTFWQKLCCCCNKPAKALVPLENEQEASVLLEVRNSQNNQSASKEKIITKAKTHHRISLIEEMSNDNSLIVLVGETNEFLPNGQEQYARTIESNFDI